MEVSLLSQHLFSPREEHLYDVYRIFSYLQEKFGNNPWRITYDPVYEPTYDNVFGVVGEYLYGWKYFYPDYQKIIPRLIPEDLGKYVVIKSYVDNNHSGNMANRRLHYGIIIHVNNSPIIWYIKLQNTVEDSSFVSVFVSLRIATDMV